MSSFTVDAVRSPGFVRSRSVLLKSGMYEIQRRADLPREDIETKAVLTACIEARATLAELRISGQLIPNQAVLINSIPLLEAQASSEIENIVTTTDRLFRFANEAGN